MKMRMSQFISVIIMGMATLLLSGCSLGDPVEVPVGYTGALINGSSGEVGDWREGPYKMKINKLCFTNCDTLAVVNLKPKSAIIDGDYWVPESKSNFDLDVAINYRPISSPAALNRLIRMDQYTKMHEKSYVNLYQGDDAFNTNVRTKVVDRVKTALNTPTANGNRLTIDQMMEDINWTKTVMVRPAIAMLIESSAVFELIDVSIPVSEYPEALKEAKNKILRVEENKIARLKEAGAELEVQAANRDLGLLQASLDVEADQLVAPSMSKKMATMLYLTALNNCATNTNGCNMVAFPPNMVDLPIDGDGISEEQIQVLMKRIAERSKG
jgi:hypothetical protein